MTRRLALLWIAAALAAFGQRRKPKQAGALHLIEATARRNEGNIELDGRVQNVGDRPIEKLVLLFDILAAGGEVITTQEGAAAEAVLDPGDESEFHWQMREPARAVHYRIAARDRAQRFVPVDHPGPYTIE